MAAQRKYVMLIGVNAGVQQRENGKFHNAVASQQ
jgi:hypothetical protein